MFKKSIAFLALLCVFFTLSFPAYAGSFSGPSGVTVGPGAASNVGQVNQGMGAVRNPGISSIGQTGNQSMGAVRNPDASGVGQIGDKGLIESVGQTPNFGQIRQPLQNFDNNKQLSNIANKLFQESERLKPEIERSINNLVPGVRDIVNSKPEELFNNINKFLPEVNKEAERIAPKAVDSAKNLMSELQELKDTANREVNKEAGKSPGIVPPGIEALKDGNFREKFREQLKDLRKQNFEEQKMIRVIEQTIEELKKQEKKEILKEALEEAIANTPKAEQFYKEFGKQFPADPQGPPTVFSNGKRLDFDVPPVIKEGRTLIPLRAVAEALGAKVDWDSNKRLVLINKGDININLYIDSKEAQVGDKKVSLDVPAQIYNNRTLVPLRFIAEALKAKVDYYPDGKVASIVDETVGENQQNAVENQQNVVENQQNAVENQQNAAENQQNVVENQQSLVNSQ